jgi:hypothetical protein
MVNCGRWDPAPSDGKKRWSPGERSPVSSHQPFDCAAGHRHVEAVQVVPDLAGAVEAVVVWMNLLIVSVSSLSRSDRAEAGRILAAK